MTHKELIQKANSGDIDAKLELAEYYYDSDDAADNAKAYELYRDLMLKDIIGGYIGVARCYRYGVGIKRNFRKTASLYRGLYKDGLLNGSDLYHYGVCLWMGLGAKLNKIRAFAIFFEVAEEGWSPAQRDLARMYNWGEGVPMNKDKAIYWYTKAAEQGCEESIAELAKLKV